MNAQAACAKPTPVHLHHNAPTSAHVSPRQAAVSQRVAVYPWHPRAQLRSVCPRAENPKNGQWVKWPRRCSRTRAPSGATGANSDPAALGRRSRTLSTLSQGDEQGQGAPGMLVCSRLAPHNFSMGRMTNMRYQSAKKWMSRRESACPQRSLMRRHTWPTGKGGNDLLPLFGLQNPLRTPKPGQARSPARPGW